MCVKVFLAIRALLSKRENITVVGEAATLSEAIQKTEELHPDEIILDLHMADGTKRQLSKWALSCSQYRLPTRGSGSIGS